MIKNLNINFNLNLDAHFSRISKKEKKRYCEKLRSIHLKKNAYFNDA